MVTWQNRILFLCIPLFFEIACGQNALVQPDLIVARLQSPDKKMQNLSIIDYSSPLDFSDLKMAQTSGSIFLGFSEFLNGDSIETVEYYTNETVRGFSGLPGTIEIAVCDLQGKNCLPFSDFKVSYRPDGGYIPPKDTSVNNFPPPAIQLNIDSKKPFPNDKIVFVYLISGKITNTNQTPMAQLSSESGPVVTSVNQSPVGAAVWFRTKPFGIAKVTYDADQKTVSVLFNAPLPGTLPTFSIDGGLVIASAVLDSTRTTVTLTLASTPAPQPSQIYNITVTGVSMSSAEFTVPGAN